MTKSNSDRRIPVSCLRRGGFAEMYRECRRKRESGRIGLVRKDGRLVAGFKT